jgi:cbb3-type cytochrome oxidase subunit 1
MSNNVQQFQYDNKIVRAFGIASFAFGVVGMLVGADYRFSTHLSFAELGALPDFWPPAPG